MEMMPCEYTYATATEITAAAPIHSQTILFGLRKTRLHLRQRQLWRLCCLYRLRIRLLPQWGHLPIEAPAFLYYTALKAPERRSADLASRR